MLKIHLINVPNQNERQTPTNNHIYTKHLDLFTGLGVTYMNISHIRVIYLKFWVSDIENNKQDDNNTIEKQIKNTNYVGIMLGDTHVGEDY